MEINFIGMADEPIDDFYFDIVEFYKYLYRLTFFNIYWLIVEVQLN